MMNKTLIIKYYEYVLWYEYVHIIFLNQFNCDKLTLKISPMMVSAMKIMTSKRTIRKIKIHKTIKLYIISTTCSITKYTSKC